MAGLKINIYTINKIASSAPEAEIILNYIKRIPWPININQLEVKGKFPPEKQKILEGELLLKTIPKNHYIIALDEKGSQFDSKEFSDFLQKQTSPISFIIGGAYGLSEEVKKKANFQISLSKMTMPHLIARTILIEQIYRAYTISENHPYHK